MHWINDKWEFQSIGLAFESLRGSHTGVNISDAFKKLLDKFGFLPKVIDSLNS